MRHWPLLSLATAAFALALPCLAAAADDKTICGDQRTPADPKIAACTRLIKSGKLGDVSLSAAFNNRGSGHADKRDLARALADYTEAIRLDPDSGAAYYNRARILEQRGELDRALADYTSAIRGAPELMEARMGRALLLLRKNDSAEAVAEANRAVQALPDHPIAFEMRAYIFKALGRREEAIADYRKSVSLAPDDAGLREEVERALRELGATP
jgi:tetratricopeptide (TPR) repeat protein